MGRISIEKVKKSETVKNENEGKCKLSKILNKYLQKLVKILKNL